MKKIRMILLASILCLAMLSPAALASDDSTSNTINTNKDQEVLLTREYLSNATISEENGYVQIVSKKQLSGNSYQKDTVMLVPKANKTVKNAKNSINAFIDSSSPMATGHNYFEDWDSTLAVKAWTTVYYSSTTVNNGGSVIEYRKMTKVTGGLSIADSTCTIASQSVIMGSVGWNPVNVYQNVSTTKTPSASTRSWSYTAPSTWQYVSTVTPVGAVGATYKIKIKRGSTTWWFYLQNQVVDVE